MSVDISDRQSIAFLDKQNVLSSIEMLPDQIKDAWAQTINQPNQEYAVGVKNIIISGMGGSTLGAHVIYALFKSKLTVPFEIVKDYTLPGYVNENTLVILSSYSGTTEETLAAGQEAIKKGAKIAVIAAGGDLIKLADEHQYPKYQINPQFNPSNQPRMAIGYAIAGQLGLLVSFGLLNLSGVNIDAITAYLQKKSASLAPESGENEAKQLAQSAVDKTIFLVSAEHLTGATHVFNNQLNENAKHLTVELQLPELNHHYLEGLSHPESAKERGIFWFINSALYSSKLQLRLKLTQDVVTQNGFASHIINLTATDPLTQAFELIQLGAYTNFYLAMLHNLDPAPIPWVDYFKGELHKASQS